MGPPPSSLPSLIHQSPRLMDSFWDLAALSASLGALVIAVVALRRSDRNASAATLVSLYEALRGAWARYLAAKKPVAAEFEFAELVNLLELACAIHQDKAVHGASREMLEEYLLDVLSIFRDDAGARQQIALLRDRPNTFKYLKRFLSEMRGRGMLGQLNDLATDVGELSE